MSARVIAVAFATLLAIGCSHYLSYVHVIEESGSTSAGAVSVSKRIASEVASSHNLTPQFIPAQVPELLAFYQRDSVAVKLFQNSDPPSLTFAIIDFDHWSQSPEAHEIQTEIERRARQSVPAARVELHQRRDPLPFGP